MTYTNFITLQDVTSSSKLWGGEEVVLLGASLTMNSENMLKFVPKTFQETNLNLYDNVHTRPYVENYNRRKTNVSYAGFNNHTFNIQILYDTTLVGKSQVLIINGVSGLHKIMTPSKIMELVLKPRTVYLKDNLIFPILAENEESDTETPAIYPSSGIPVLLKSWSFKPVPNTTQVEISLTFVEDRY